MTSPRLADLLDRLAPVVREEMLKDDGFRDIIEQQPAEVFPRVDA